MRRQSTTRNLSNALKLAKSFSTQPDTGVEVAYDRKTGSWSAWKVDYNDMHQIGLAGQGKDPMAAVEAMIENNKPDYSSESDGVIYRASED